VNGPILYEFVKQSCWVCWMDGNSVEWPSKFQRNSINFVKTRNIKENLKPSWKISGCRRRSWNLFRATFKNPEQSRENEQIASLKFSQCVNSNVDYWPCSMWIA